MEPLLARKLVTLMTVELDASDAPGHAVLEQISCVASRHGYAVWLKVPCAGSGDWNARPAYTSQRAAYMPISGRYHHTLPEEPSAAFASALHSVPQASPDVLIQDVLLTDLAHTELRHLVALGNLECGTSFPAGVTEAWAEPMTVEDSAAAAADGADRSSAPLPPFDDSMSVEDFSRSDALVGEGERLRSKLWKSSESREGDIGARSDPARGRSSHEATLLADGSWSCFVVGCPTNGCCGKDDDEAQCQPPFVDDTEASSPGCIDSAYPNTNRLCCAQCQTNLTKGRAGRPICR